ncbi:hypothetical protein LAZ67_11000250 [Cordylochernes scorpioides]|uniref:Chitin-binding type-2 domain-containing protein n=1 Tax=Cordylochernes scorpioides TaxID=51811 RepID=A0ABY6KYG7_9ARAC|nr:hypothetical protein LAZ67_11000250 [Cordylochernes scorpioides]
MNDKEPMRLEKMLGRRRPGREAVSNRHVSSSVRRTHRSTDMKVVIVLACSLLVVALPRVRRQTAYVLPDGAELVVGSIKTSFSCQGLRYGYYADVDNNCQIFHVCSETHGAAEVRQWSFFCGNLTIFNQLTLTCTYPEDAVPCSSAPEFYSLNDNIGVEDSKFLRDEDVERARQLRA